MSFLINYKQFYIVSYSDLPHHIGCFLKFTNQPELYPGKFGIILYYRGLSKVGAIREIIDFGCFFDLWAALTFDLGFSWKNRYDFRIRRRILHGGRYLRYIVEFFWGSYENYCYVKNDDFCGTEIYRNSCSKDLRWKCHYCTKNENNNAMQQYFNVSAKKMVLSPFFTVFPEQKFQMSWFSKFLFRISQNWFPKWFKMIFLWKLMKTLKKLTPLKFWGPGTKFS